AQKEVDLEDLRARILVTREKGSALHAAVEQLLGTKALSSKSVIMLGETEAIKRCVEAGLGVALIQRLAVEREVKAGALQSLSLTGGQDVRQYYYAFRHSSKPSAAAQAFVDLLTKAGGE